MYRRALDLGNKSQSFPLFSVPGIYHCWRFASPDNGAQKAISPYRTNFHKSLRGGLSEGALNHFTEDELALNVGAETPGDILHGMRASILAMDASNNKVHLACLCCSLCLIRAPTYHLQVSALSTFYAGRVKFVSP